MVNLTSGEVTAAREDLAVTDLFIVHGVKIEDGEAGPKASGGKVRVIQGWKPDDADLEPTQFRYKVPSRSEV